MPQKRAFAGLANQHYQHLFFLLGVACSRRSDSGGVMRKDAQSAKEWRVNNRPSERERLEQAMLGAINGRSFFLVIIFT